MENFEQNSNDGSAGKEDGTSEKITLRLPESVVRKIRAKATEWQVPQSVAASRLLSEEAMSPHAKPIIKGKFAYIDDEELRSETQKEFDETWERLDDFANETTRLESRIEEITKLQDALFAALKTEATAATKATKNFAELGTKSELAIATFAELEKQFKIHFDVQRSTVQGYLEATKKEIISGAFDGHAIFEERVDKKLRAAETLITRADKLDSTFGNYFTEGVARFLPEVESLKGSIEGDLKKIKIFHSVSYVVAGFAFILGLAAVTYYRPVLDLWDKDQVAIAATKSVSEAYTKQLTDAESRIKNLEYDLAMVKADEAKRVADAKADAEDKARAAAETFRIKAFEKQAQRFQKELEVAGRNVGYLKQKLAENCQHFCFGSMYNGE